MMNYEVRKVLALAVGRHRLVFCARRISLVVVQLPRFRVGPVRSEAR